MSLLTLVGCRAFDTKEQQGNITDRVICSLKSLLLMITDMRKDWNAYLPQVGFAARTTVNRSRFTPVYLS